MFLPVLPPPFLLLGLVPALNSGTGRTRKLTALLLILTLSACTAPASLSPAIGQAVLARAWQADQHSVWEIDWPAAPIGGPLTVETWRAGSRYRYEILEATAPDLVGQILIFDGQTAWSYKRFDPPQVPHPTGEERLSPVTDAFDAISRLMGTVAEMASQEVVLLPSGPAQKLTLTYPNDKSLTFWRDEATGLPVRVIFTLKGQAATLRARSFAPLPDPPDGLFKP